MASANQKLQIIESVKDLQQVRKNISGSVGFVPTMGALHQGHSALLKKSVAENQFTFLSIFVNPTQFNQAEDLLKYPKTLEQDLRLAHDAGVSFVFIPNAQEIYQDQYRYKISESGLSEKFCGAYRPGHFTGVLTVVMKLLQLVKADRAYFGEKDFQQLQLIKDMVNTFFVPTEIIGVPTVRQDSGLALSSRNLRLSPSQLEVAAQFFKILSTEKENQVARQKLETLGFKVEYIENYENRRLAAAFLGEVRLIDNVPKI